VENRKNVHAYLQVAKNNFLARQDRSDMNIVTRSDHKINIHDVLARK